MLTTTQRDEAARHLLAARRVRQPGPRLPESCRPTELEDALAIQRRVQELLGVATGGWKCSLPTAERAISCAAIFAPTIARASPCLVTGRGGVARIEPEVAFVLGRDLPHRAAPYGEAQVRAAIAEVRLVLELLDSRYADPAAVAFPELLADHVSNQGLFIGPLLRDGLQRELAGFAIAIKTPTATLHARNGRHPDGHPLRPLLWLANFLAGRAEFGGLKAGDIVTTGSYAGALEVPIATPLRVKFGDLGEFGIELSRREA
jgi:2-keto-4-pentenoate hydratase